MGHGSVSLDPSVSLIYLFEPDVLVDVGADNCPYSGDRGVPRTSRVIVGGPHPTGAAGKTPLC